MIPRRNLRGREMAFGVGYATAVNRRQPFQAAEVTRTNGGTAERQRAQSRARGGETAPQRWWIQPSVEVAQRASNRRRSQILFVGIARIPNHRNAAVKHSAITTG